MYTNICGLRDLLGMRLIHDKGGSSTTNVQSYTPTAQEVGLQQQALDYSKAVSPNALSLNTTAKGLLDGSYGTVQADYGTLTNNANKQQASAQNGVAGLTQGLLPSAYQQNMENSIRTGVNNTVGNTLAGLNSRGILNSSVTNNALNNITQNVSDTMANKYSDNISTLNGLYGQQAGLANNQLTTTAAGQEAALATPLSLWNASLGLNQGGTTNALNAVSGQGTTTSTSTTRGGGSGLFGGVLTGLASGYAGNTAGIFCFGAGTQIEQPTGFIPIEGVKVGEEVLAPDKDCLYVRDVIAVLEGGRTAKTVRLTTTLGDVITTPTQPLRTPKGYVLVADMKVGDEIHHHGRTVKITGLEYAGLRRVYDLKVRKNNAYIANGFIAKGGENEW